MNERLSQKDQGGMSLSSLKVCIIGSTGHWDYVLQGLNELKGLELAGVAPGSEGEKMESLLMRTEGHYPALYTDYHKMLDSIKPDIVAVACYFSDHAEITTQLLKRGIHVFVEKPLATKLEDLEKLKMVYETEKLHLAAILELRYAPWFSAAHRAVTDGAIGDIRLIHAQKSYKLGLRDYNYRERAIYGGTIPWVGSHAIDWLWWFTQKKFKSVYASHSTCFNRNHGDLEITALCHFQLEDEILGSVSMDYLRPETAPDHADDRLCITGTRGVIEVRQEQAYLTNDETKETRKLPLLSRENIFSDFVRQVGGEGRCRVSAEDSFYVTRACLKARESADKDELVYFEA